MSVQEGEYCGFLTTIAEPGILVVTFNRPESLNASTAAMKRDLVELLTQTQMDDAIRIVVFTGQGSAFWAGDDLKGYGGDSVQVPQIHHGHHNPSGKGAYHLTKTTPGQRHAERSRSACI